MSLIMTDNQLLAVIKSYPTSASGLIVLLKRPQNTIRSSAWISWLEILSWLLLHLSKNLQIDGEIICVTSCTLRSNFWNPRKTHKSTHDLFSSCLLGQSVDWPRRLAHSHLIPRRSVGLSPCDSRQITYLSVPNQTKGAVFLTLEITSELLWLNYRIQDYFQSFVKGAGSFCSFAPLSCTSSQTSH